MCWIQQWATWTFLFAGWSSAASAGHPAAALLPGRPVDVVLVHGILDTGSRFDVLRRALEEDGCRCLAPSLRPNDGSTGVRDLSTKLAAAVDARFGHAEPIFLVGFSMGGLAVRDYVQNVLTDRSRVRGVFLISTPNHGTLWAGASPNPKMRQLALGSSFLATLNAQPAAWKRVPVFSYWTPLDLMVVPATSSLRMPGTTRAGLCPIHPWMTRDPLVVRDILARIRAASSVSAW